jgi:hypothetical protein
MSQSHAATVLGSLPVQRTSNSAYVPIGAVVRGKVCGVILLVLVIAFWITHSRSGPQQERENYSANPGHGGYPMHGGGLGAPPMFPALQPTVNYGGGGLNLLSLPDVSDFELIGWLILTPFLM